jgi:hypothetical protein
VDLDHRLGYPLPPGEARLRLEQPWLWRRLCRLYLPYNRFPDQLPVSVSSTIGNPLTAFADPSSYFFVTNLAKGEDEIIRYAALLRGTESAWQAVSYGLTSITIFAEVGATYINFGLWGLGLFPAWLVLKNIGVGKPADSEAQGTVGDAVATSETQSDSDVKAVQEGQNTKAA